MQADITVVIPCYNCGAFIGDTLKSVSNQTYPYWQCLIVDDCSTDDTARVAEAYCSRDPRMRLVRNPERLGMLRNWNRSIGLVETPFFCKLDADDLFAPTMLEKARDLLLEHPSVGLVFSRYLEIDTNGAVISGSEWQLPLFAKKPFRTRDLIRLGPARMLSYPILRQGLSLMRLEAWKRVGPYRHLRSIETQASTDTEFYYRLGLHYDICCIDLPLYFYRIHHDSVTASDHSRGLSLQKRFETKYCILDYAYSQGVLSGREFRSYMREIRFEYALNKLHAVIRREGLWALARGLGELMFIDFARTLVFLGVAVKKRARLLWARGKRA